jgi:hypothetical protein
MVNIAYATSHDYMVANAYLAKGKVPVGESPTVRALFQHATNLNVSRLNVKGTDYTVEGQQALQFPQQPQQEPQTQSTQTSIPAQELSQPQQLSQIQDSKQPQQTKSFNDYLRSIGDWAFRKNTNPSPTTPINQIMSGQKELYTKPQEQPKPTNDYEQLQRMQYKPLPKINPFAPSGSKVLEQPKESANVLAATIPIEQTAQQREELYNKGLAASSEQPATFFQKASASLPGKAIATKGTAINYPEQTVSDVARQNIMNQKVMSDMIASETISNIQNERLASAQAKALKAHDEAVSRIQAGQNFDMVNKDYQNNIDAINTESNKGLNEEVVKQLESNKSYQEQQKALERTLKENKGYVGESGNVFISSNLLGQENIKADISNQLKAFSEADINRKIEKLSEAGKEAIQYTPYGAPIMIGQGIQEQDILKTVFGGAFTGGALKAEMSAATTQIAKESLIKQIQAEGTLSKDTLEKGIARVVVEGKPYEIQIKDAQALQAQLARGTATKEFIEKGLGNVIKFEGTGKINEYVVEAKPEVINALQRNEETKPLVELFKNADIIKAVQETPKGEKVRYAVTNTFGIGDEGKRLSLSFRLGKEGQLVAPRLNLIDLKTGVSLPLRYSSPSELSKWYEMNPLNTPSAFQPAVEVSELKGWRLSADKVLQTLSRSDINFMKTPSGEIRIADKTGATFKVGSKIKQTFSFEDISKLLETKGFSYKNVAPKLTSKTTSKEVQVLTESPTMQGEISKTIEEGNIKMTKAIEATIQEKSGYKYETGKSQLAKDIEKAITFTEEKTRKVKPMKEVKMVDLNRPLKQPGKFKELPSFEAELPSYVGGGKSSQGGVSLYEELSKEANAKAFSGNAISFEEIGFNQLKAPTEKQITRQIEKQLGTQTKVDAGKLLRGTNLIKPVEVYNPGEFDFKSKFNQQDFEKKLEVERTKLNNQMKNNVKELSFNANANFEKLSQPSGTKLNQGQINAQLQKLEQSQINIPEQRMQQQQSPRVPEQPKINIPDLYIPPFFPTPQSQGGGTGEGKAQQYGTRGKKKPKYAASLINAVFQEKPFKVTKKQMKKLEQGTYSGFESLPVLELQGEKKRRGRKPKGINIDKVFNME